MQIYIYIYIYYIYIYIYMLLGFALRASGRAVHVACCVHVRFRILSQPKHIGEFDEN